jgi:hypothetical protein
MAWVALALMLSQFALSALPWALFALGWEYPWRNGLLSFSCQLPFLVVIILLSLLTAAALRRLMQLSKNNWGLMVCTCTLVIIASLLANIIRKAIPSSELQMFNGLNFWLDAWLIAVILSMKPVFDHMLDLMHPRPAASTKPKMKRKHISRTKRSLSTRKRFS